MRPRYLAFAGTYSPEQRRWAHHVALETARNCQLECMVESEELLVLSKQAFAQRRFESSCGILLGTAFTHTSEPELDAVSEAQIRASAGAWLAQHVWGEYVAILNGADRNVHVVRDPSGGVPCYYLQHDEVTIVASDIEILTASGLLRLEIDWDYVGRHLIANELRTARTGVVGITELLRGFSLTVGPSGRRLKQIWSPWDYAHHDRQIDDEAVAVARLCETAQYSVAAWVPDFSHLLLGISGGLDSSIVAACLAKADASFSCLTLATENPTGDERVYARLVAEAVGVELFEAFRDVSKVDIARSHAAHLPRPVARLFAQESDRINLEIAERVGAHAFYSGGGGDNVFCYLQSVAPLADRLLVEGFGRGAWRTAKDISMMAGCSLWTAGSRAIRRAWFRKLDFHWPTNMTLLNPEVGDLAWDRQSHPWLEAPADALPGKAAHIALLMNIQNHLEAPDRDRVGPTISPLMSQPMMELCLQIPTWMWCAGGHNRMIARRAFAQDLPAAIINRRSKGTPDSFAAEIFETHRQGIREMLMDGLLARQGFLDREAIEQALADAGPVRGLAYRRILAFVDVEAWAQAWSSRVRTSKTSHVAASG